MDSDYPKPVPLYTDIFHDYAGKAALSDSLLKEQEEISQRCEESLFQDSVAARNVERARSIAYKLIGEKGEFQEERLPEIITRLEEQLCSLGPGREHDIPRQKHLLKVLYVLREDREAKRLLLAVSCPENHKVAEQLIRDTLQLPPGETITDVHTKRAVLSAWLTYLRQSVGSCFATALAIRIQNEQPKNFLKDLNLLLSTGKLSRIVGGIEYAVPLAMGWGVGDLKKPVFVTSTQTPFWKSPGLARAFSAAALFTTKNSPREQEKFLKEQVVAFLKIQELPGYVTADQLIRHVLMSELKVSEQDLQDYEHRAVGSLQSKSLLQIQRRGVNPKFVSCEKFQARYGVARSAFKALTENALLKAWEFTLASFSETKAEFARWNMYASLGLEPEQPGGIGACLYQNIQSRLDDLNAQVQGHQEKYEAVFGTVKYLEGRIQRASSESELKALRGEYQGRVSEMNHYLDLRDKASIKAQRWANLFAFLINSYIEKLQDYFQEVYDAEMQDVTPSFYDDSPAGFRLLYKHGRRNTALWSLIYTPTEYVQALVDFFVATEVEISTTPELEGMQQEFGQLVTALVTLVKTDGFLLGALQRMSEAHGVALEVDPLQNLDKVAKKPWVYVSGGTVGTLMSCYYHRQQPATEEARWVETVEELAVFFLDTMRGMTSSMAQPFAADSARSLLAYSPTHVFRFKPGLKPFCAGWQTKAYPYTWLKETYINAAKTFWERLRIEESSAEFLIGKMAEAFPKKYRELFRRLFPTNFSAATPMEFRKVLLERLFAQEWYQGALRLALLPDEIDHRLHSWLPVTPYVLVEERVKAICHKLGLQVERELEAFVKRLAYGKPLVARELIDAVKAILMMHFQTPNVAEEWHSKVLDVVRECGYAAPCPLLFADTNWSQDYFSFVVSPGSGELELWRTDWLGFSGYPMSIWRDYMNGRQKRKWGVYTRPAEYGG